MEKLPDTITSTYLEGLQQRTDRRLSYADSPESLAIMAKEALEFLEEAHKRWVHYLAVMYSPKLNEDQVEQFVKCFMDEKISRPQRIETLIGKILDITNPDS